jgi:hypothetical protein
MDFNYRLGIFLLIIGTGASLMIGTHYTGIALLCLGIIWWFLFLYPKSPVKKYWWSISNKLAVIIIKLGVYGAKANDKYITIHFGLRAQTTIKVNTITIKIKGYNEIPPFNWKTKEITADEHILISFITPIGLKTGDHQAQLKVYTSDGYSKSARFTLEARIGQES